MLLKRCPYCRGKAEIRKEILLSDNGDEDIFWVHCVECDASTEYWAKKRWAIQAWNRRKNVQ